MINKIYYILFFIPWLALSQTPDLTACAVNITDNANIQVQNLEAFDNLILLQSGTRLRINSFSGRSNFVHGYKALEEDNNYIKPVLIIRQCAKGSVINIGKGIIYRVHKSCGIAPKPNQNINIFNNEN